MPVNKLNARALLEQSENAARARLQDGKAMLQSPAAVVNADNAEATVYIYDAIGGWWGIDPAAFVPALDALTAKTIHLRINSPGGVVTDAEAIQAAVQRKKQAGCNIVAHIDGFCASAATYIAISATSVEMADGSFFMIHNAWGVGMGEAKDMRALAELLDKMGANIRADYAAKTGKSDEQLQAWMDAETWFTAQEALENGFVDSISPKSKEGGESSAKNSAATCRTCGKDMIACTCGNTAENSAHSSADDGHAQREAEIARAARARSLALVEIGV